METVSRKKCTATLTIKVAAEPEFISVVRHQIASHMRTLALAEDMIDSVVLAVGEACSNAVSYGKAQSAQPKLLVTCSCSHQGNLQIDIQNEGNGFHPELASIAHLPNPESYATHGRGFALMRALMDEVVVLSKNGSTVVRLTKYSSNASSLLAPR